MGNQVTLLRDYKLAFKGIHLKTFERWAGKAAPIVSLITTVFEAYQAGKHEDEQNEKQKIATLQLHQMINNISDELINNLTTESNKSITLLFKNPIQQNKDKLSELNTNENIVEKDYENLKLIISQLNEIAVH